MEDTHAITTLDDSISEYFEKEGDKGAIITGWILSVSVKHPSLPSSDGYFTTNSPGLPHHSQVGLLHGALNDMQATVIANQLKAGNR